MPSPYLFQPVASGGGSSSSVNESFEVTNLAIATSVSSNALTISLKGKDGLDPSATNVVLIGFRDATATSGVYVQRTVTAALSVVVSSGSTLGMTSAIASHLYVYALDNGGAVELAVINGSVDEGSLQTTTAEGAAGAADSANVLYSTTARTSKAVRLIGRILITEATAGTWASNATEVSVLPFRGPVGRQGLVTTFNASGTFTTPSNSTTSTIYKYTITSGGGGAGGSGASGNTGCSGGGGAGGSAMGTFTGVAPNTGITITIGAGGAGGASGGANNGTVGGTSSIGSPLSVSVTGGAGTGGYNSAATNYGGTGGTPSGGTLNIAGGYGQSCTLARTGGMGGSSYWGGGGSGGLSGVNGAGTSATAWGAGGGGGVDQSASGGSGKDGICVIEQLTP